MNIISPNIIPPNFDKKVVVCSCSNFEFIDYNFLISILGLCADHLRPGLSQYPQAPMRLPTPPDMSLAYPNGHIKSLPMQGPSPLLLHPAMVGPPSSPGPVLQPPHGHHPHLFQEPGRIPEMPSHMASASATCSHHHISGELPSPSPGNLYSMGPSPGMGGPPYDSFMLNSAGELQSLTGAVSSMSVGKY